MNEFLAKQVGFVVLQLWQTIAERDELKQQLEAASAKLAEKNPGQPA